MDCDKALNQGVEVDDDDFDLGYAFYFKRQCPYWRDKYLRIVHKKDTNLVSPIEKPKFNSPITEDGTYIFLFDQDGQFWNTKVDNYFEYGQIHLTLVFASKVYESKIKRVIAAGEIRKTGSTLEFNLQSGTFMADWLVKELNNQCTDALVKQTEERLVRLHPSLKIVYRNETFINNDSLKMDSSFLDKLYRAGFEIRMYDDDYTCMSDPHELNEISNDKTLSITKRANAAYELRLFNEEYMLYKPSTQAGKRKTRQKKNKRKTTRRRLSYN